jgi:hypothetical protein
VSWQSTQVFTIAAARAGRQLARTTDRPGVARRLYNALSAEPPPRWSAARLRERFARQEIEVLARRLIRIGLLTPAFLLVSCTAPPLELGTADLEDAVQGWDYSQQLRSAGEPPLHWSVSDGALPPGLILSSGGEIVGTPDEPGEFAFTVRVRDSSFPVRAGEQAYSITVLPRLRITVDLPAARVFEPYQFTPVVEGGVPPYVFEAIGLPAGLGVNPETGTISGVPITAYPALRIDLRVADSGQPQQTATDTDFLVIKAQVVEIVTTDLPAGEVGVAYSQQVVAENGQPPYLWAVTEGLLPDGLHLNIVTGVVSGTPTTAQTTTFTVRVTDSDNPSNTDATVFTLEIAP